MKERKGGQKTIIIKVIIIEIQEIQEIQDWLWFFLDVSLQNAREEKKIVGCNTIYDHFFTFVLSAERRIYGNILNYRHIAVDLSVLESCSILFRE